MSPPSTDSNAQSNGHHQQQDQHGSTRPSSGMLRPAIRNEVVAFVGEFCGTFMFLFLAFMALQTAQNRNAAAVGAIQATDQPEGAAEVAARPDIATLLYISLAFGFSLAVNCWLFYRISGGMFNPVVSVALLLVGAITPIRLAVVVPAQMIASIACSWLLSALLPGDLTVSTTVAPSVTLAQAVFIEMFLTVQLVLTILLLAVEKHKATFLAPMGIGLALFVGHLAGVLFTGGSMNPARSFGPATVEGFPSSHWVYWVGPLLGAVLAVVGWKVLRLLEFETSNPGQDFDELESGLFDAPEWASTRDDVKRPVPPPSGKGIGGMK